MKRMYRRWNLKKIIWRIMIIMTLLSVCMAFYGCYKWVEYSDRYQKAEQKLEECLKIIYVADRDLAKGTVLTKENIRTEMHYTDISEEYISEAELGHTLLINVKKGTCVTKGMLEDVTEKTREVYISEVRLAEHLKMGDRIDVRISYPNAEDYVVLSEKNMVLMDENGGMVLNLSEEEILYLSSAAVDCREYKDTFLYAVKYPQETQVAESEVSYLPRKEIQITVGLYSKKGEEREALEERLLSKKNR